jgi:hypothetical protein
MFFLPHGSVAGVRERLLSFSEAGIASHLRRKGCAKDPAARLCGRGGFGQGKPPQAVSPPEALSIVNALI